MTPALRVLSPGLQTTVQDLGRPGWRHLGVSLAGALDPALAALANRLVGNDDEAAVLELTLHGPKLQLLRPLRLALAGARVQARFDGIELPGERPIDLPAGTLELGPLQRGARAWLALAGGVDVPPVLGSRSTDLRGGFGGCRGRELRRGDELALLSPPTLDCERPRIAHWWVEPGDARDPAGSPATIRYRPATGTETDAFETNEWRVSPQSNRQGLRLEGERLPAETASGVSAPVAPGTIQLPADGQPIVLLADAQTVGGYARLGHVIAADLPRLAQCVPGDRLRFRPCDEQAARAAACRQRTQMARMTLMIERALERRESP